MGWNRFKDSVIGSQNYAWPESEIESQNNLSRVRVSNGMSQIHMTRQ